MPLNHLDASIDPKTPRHPYMPSHFKMFHYPINDVTVEAAAGEKQGKTQRLVYEAKGYLQGLTTDKQSLSHSIILSSPNRIYAAWRDYHALCVPTPCGKDVSERLGYPRSNSDVQDIF